MCVCVSVNMCVYVCVSVGMCECLRESVCVCLCVCVCLYVRISFSGFDDEIEKTCMCACVCRRQNCCGGLAKQCRCVSPFACLVVTCIGCGLLVLVHSTGRVSHVWLGVCVYICVCMYEYEWVGACVCTCM